MVLVEFFLGLEALFGGTALEVDGVFDAFILRLFVNYERVLVILQPVLATRLAVLKLFRLHCWCECTFFKFKFFNGLASLFWDNKFSVFDLILSLQTFIMISFISSVVIDNIPR